MAKPCFELLSAALAGIARDRDVSWHTYVSDCKIDDESIVSFAPKLMDSDVSGLESLVQYCHFITGQGFYLQAAIHFNNGTADIHVLSWEGDEEPYWPDGEAFDLIIRTVL